jgi:hypothetical protein
VYGSSCADTRHLDESKKKKKKKKKKNKKKEKEEKTTKIRKKGYTSNERR